MTDAENPQDANGHAPPAPADNKTATELVLRGSVDHIVYSNPENSYTVASLKIDGSGTDVIIVGSFAGLQVQEVLEVRGHYVFDRKYGRQFRVNTYTAVLPSTSAAIEKFLGSGLIRGIGKVYARRLVEHLGAEIFDIIDRNPEQLAKVPGIGAKRASRIRAGWEEHRTIRELLLFLQQYDIPQGLAWRIYKQYGAHSIPQIRKNPYQLAIEVRGIGFKTADKIAQKIGIPVESIERCKAGVFFMLQELAEEGHCFFPADPLIARGVETLGVEQKLIIDAINALKAEDHVVLEVLPDGTRAAYLRRIHMHESSAAELIVRLLNTGKLVPRIHPEQELDAFESQFRFKLAENQRVAITGSLRGGVLVITGGPGTGKTTIVKAILRILKRFGISALLAAPTGRAAKRMQELTNVQASTIHRLLKFSPQESKYLHNPHNPLRGDFIIVDEASMIDIALANSLLRAIPATSSVILVGDVDQLPSVGPGNFLKDLIASGVVPVVKLNEIFRQAQQSLIITNAHKINIGQAPSLRTPEDQGKTDFYFVEADEPELALDVVKKLVRLRIPAKFGLDPVNDVQVISPMHRGVIGAQNLNRELQQLLNPSGTVIERAGISLRSGDKVMQTVNNYDKDVFNGDIGRVASIDREDGLVKVNFDGRIVTYELRDLDELELAYAISVHKSQGSEYPAVVMPIHTTHFVMLQRNLLYTGVTRGKKLVCLVGQKRAVHMAVKNVSQEPRFSALNQRLAVLRQASASPSGL